jgi:hypothetical protein
MIKIVRSSLLVILLQLLAAGATSAAPAPPLESYLLRAETVFIGCIVDRTDKDVSFEVVELLRSQAREANSLRRYAIDKEGFVMKESPTWLVISQGDNHFGKPKQIMSLGPQLDGQSSYRGWIAFPIREDGDEPRLDQVYTFVDHKAGEPLMRLTLRKARVLIDQFRYKPNLHDTVPNQSLKRRRN